LRDEAALLDIVRAGQLILEFAQELDYSQLAADLRSQSAIPYQIGVMGEATKRLSREFRAQHPEVPWSDIAGIRDVVVHQYDRIDLDIIFQVVHRNVPELLDVLMPLLPNDEAH
jgi:uncharacterized protein with HEPN domain